MRMEGQTEGMGHIHRITTPEYSLINHKKQGDGKCQVS